MSTPTLRVGTLSVRTDRRAWVAATALLLAVVAVGIVSLSTGDFQIPLARVVRTLLGDGSAAEVFIVETLRLPRLTVGLLVGAALGIGGTMFQSVARNPLGSPDVVGFDSGAATGALVVILVWHGTAAQIALGAIVGGVGTALAVYLLAMRHGVHGYRLILIGMGIAAILTALNDYLLTRARVNEAQNAMLWLIGSLTGRGWEQARPLAVLLVVLVPAALWIGRGLRMLELGDDAARSLGVRAERTRLAAVIVGVGLSAAAAAAAGPIAFVALAAPQIARRLTRVSGPNIVASALTGALLLSLSDLAAQRLFPSIALPVGVMTAAVGGIYLAWLLSTQWRRGQG